MTNTERRVAILVMSFCSLFGVVISCRRATQQGRGSGLEETKTQVALANSPVDLHAQTLAPGFAGNDIEMIFKSLVGVNSQKGEFETTQDFKKRIDSQKDLPLPGSLTLDSTVGFVIPLEDSDTSYNADTGVMRMEMPLRYGVPDLNGLEPSNPVFSCLWIKSADHTLTEGQGTNAFGVTQPIKIDRATFYRVYFRDSGMHNAKLSASLNLAPNDASKMKQQIRGLVLGKIVPPYLWTEDVSEEASLDYPVKREHEARYVHISVLGLWFFDSSSGTILAKLHMPNR